MKMDKILKQAQRMQAQMMLAQEELEHASIEGAAGGGVVKAVVNGSGELLSISIDKEAVNPEETEMLEDLVLGAIKEAQSKAKTFSENKMSSVTGGIPGFPGLM